MNASNDTTPYRIPMRDEADLSWFFGPGAACFEKSTFGIALERAVQFGQCAEPCAECAGLGFVELTAEQIVERAKLFDALTESRKHDDATAGGRSDEEIERLREKRDAEHRAICAQSDCQACKGKKLVQRRVRRRRGSPRRTTMCCTTCHGSRRTHNGDRCPSCDGAGYVVPVTVNAKPASKEGDGWCPDDESLMRYARVSKRLDRLSEAAFEALKLFYGDRGARWASSLPGRLLALYPLTAAGAKLAARGITKAMRETLGDLGVRLDEAIWNECEAQRAKPEENRKRQLEKARDQAAEILESASVEWRETGPMPKLVQHTNVTATASLEALHPPGCVTAAAECAAPAEVA